MESKHKSIKNPIPKSHPKHTKWKIVAIGGFLSEEGFYSLGIKKAVVGNYAGKDGDEAVEIGAREVKLINDLILFDLYLGKKLR